MHMRALNLNPAHSPINYCVGKIYILENPHEQHSNHPYQRRRIRERRAEVRYPRIGGFLGRMVWSLQNDRARPRRGRRSLRRKDSNREAECRRKRYRGGEIQYSEYSDPAAVQEGRSGRARGGRRIAISSSRLSRRAAARHRCVTIPNDYRTRAVAPAAFLDRTALVRAFDVSCTLGALIIAGINPGKRLLISSQRC